MTTIEKANGQGLNKSQYKNKVFTPKEMIDYSDGGIVSKELIHTQAGSVTLFSFDEGQQLSEHSAPFDAMVTVIDGEPEIFIDGVAHYPKAGDHACQPSTCCQCEDTVQNDVDDDWRINGYGKVY